MTFLFVVWIFFIIMSLAVDGAQALFPYILVLPPAIFLLFHPQLIVYGLAWVASGFKKQSKAEEWREIILKEDNVWTTNDFLGDFLMLIQMGYGEECINRRKEKSSFAIAKNEVEKLFLSKDWPTFKDLKSSGLTIEMITAFFVCKVKQMENAAGEPRWYMSTSWKNPDDIEKTVRVYNIDQSDYWKNMKASPSWSIADQDLFNSDTPEGRAFREAKRREGIGPERCAKEDAFKGGFRWPKEEVDLIRWFVSADCTEMPSHEQWIKWCIPRRFFDGPDPLFDNYAPD